MDQEISWSFWTGTIKTDLIRELFRKIPKPGAPVIKALRVALNALFPKLMGYAKLFDISSIPDAVPVFVEGVLSKNPAYQSNLARCKKVKIEPWQAADPSHPS